MLSTDANTADPAHALHGQLEQQVSITLPGSQNNMPVQSIQIDVKSNSQNLKIELEQQSLKQAKPQISLTMRDKVELLIKISQKMQALHEMSPPFIHGHLSPNNILFDKQYNVLIGDIGFDNLKKFMSITNGYSNKSVYTAAEHLAQKGLIVKQKTEKSDVYSFAMIAWELCVQK